MEIKVNPFTLESFEEKIGPQDNEIIIGMSYHAEFPTVFRTFERGKYADRSEWIKSSYEYFVFQHNRDDIRYLEVVSRCDNKFFSTTL